MISSKYSLKHVSTGDILRSEVQSGSEIGLKAKIFMDRGELVPNDLINDLLKQMMLKAANSTPGYIIDGYPRNIEQAKLFEKSIARYDAAIYFKILDSTMKQRIKTKHDILIQSKRIKVSDMCLKDRMARKPTSGPIRTEETEDILMKRIEYFHKDNEPMIKQLSKKKKSYFEIDAENTVEAIFAKVVDAIDKIDKKK